MKKFLIDPSLNFYKGNMHCHSTLSDGTYTPLELKDLYKSKGYSFLAITDHEYFTCHKDIWDDEFITITSSEYAIKEFPKESTLVNWKMKVCHLNLYSIDPDNTYNICYSSVADHYSDKSVRTSPDFPKEEYERIYGADGINDIIKEANRTGHFVCYNHPRWSLENYGDYGKYEGLWGVEIYNTGVNNSGIYEYNVNVADDFLRDGKKIFLSCGDDNHRADDMFESFVMVNAKTLSYSSIIEGLLKGNFYSSCAPTIKELYVEDNTAYITCSPAEKIALSTEGRRADCVIGNNITSASFPLLPDDGYFRIEITDEKGRKANTQSYFIENL